MVDKKVMKVKNCSSEIATTEERWKWQVRAQQSAGMKYASYNQKHMSSVLKFSQHRNGFMSSAFVGYRGVFWMNLSPPYSELKTKPSKKPA
jgi:hypothetical protein